MAKTKIELISCGLIFGQFGMFSASQIMLTLVSHKTLFASRRLHIIFMLMAAGKCQGTITGKTLASKQKG